MSLGFWVVLVSWIASAIILYLVIPRSRVREFIAVILFFQMVTWLFSITLCAFGVLSSSVRIFDWATKISFTAEFIVYPTAAVIFHRWFPEHGGKIRVFSHYMLCLGGILLYLLIQKYSSIYIFKMEMLIPYSFNFLFELWVCRRYMVWLMQNTALQSQNGVS